MAKITSLTAERVSSGDYLYRDLGALTSAGSTTPQQVNGLKNHVFQVTTSDYSLDVVFKCEGSLDGTNWMNLDADNASQTVTANGTTGYYMYNTPLEYVRITFVSGTGTITTLYAGSK